MIYIYCIWFPISEKYYVGQTKHLKIRMQEHLKSNKLIGKALWKYDDWQVSILHTCKTRDEANRIEIGEIRNFNSGAPNGYNLTAGGDGGNYWKGKKRPELSEQMKGNKRGLGNRGIKGQKRSTESIEKSRAGNLGSKRSAKAKANIKSGRLKPQTEIKRLRTWIKRLESELKDERKKN